MSSVHNACRELPAVFQEVVKSLVTSYIFEIESGPKGKTNIVEHRIYTGYSKPICQVSRQLQLIKHD